MKVNHDEIRWARKANLAEFLISEYPDEFQEVGDSVVSIREKGLSMRWGFPGYHNFATGESGNPIDYLVQHRGYTFPKAVQELCRFQQDPHPVQENRPFQLPASGLKNSLAIQYLICRGIPEGTIQELLQQKLLYQDDRNNAVFVNVDQNYCEIRGTGAVPFYGCRKTSGTHFWYIPCVQNPKTAYVCEGAIDAISLRLLHRAQGLPDALYVSIGGPGNQRALNCLKETYHVVLAVDNDEEGERCRKRNPDLPFILPVHKDWNDDLLAGV